MKTIFSKQARLMTALFTLPFILASCMVGPDYSQPSTPTPTAYKDSGPWKKAEPNDHAIRGPWWEVYHDPKLNEMEAQVNISNQNVIEAEAQFREAAAAVKVARAGLYPTITANPTYTATHSAQLSSGSSANNSSSGGVVGGSGKKGNSGISDFYDLPLEASYMLDVWGQVRRGIEANSATAQASYAALENARLSYQATLAVDYFSLRGIDAQQQLLETTVKSYETYLTLTTNRYKSGIASENDVAQAQTQIDNAKAQLIDLGVQRAQYEHAIATLMGKPASNFSLGKTPLTAFPPHVPVGVPSTLLERRPDIAEAERSVAAANAQIGVATAAYYPSITLSASTGTEAIQLSQLFSGPSFFWSVGPVLAQTLFNGGATHGQVQEAQANYEALVAAYRQTSLTAFQQVEDDLSGLRILADEQTVTKEAVDSSQKSLDIATNLYKAGTEDYLDVIVAQSTNLTDRLADVKVQTNRMTTSVLLVEALGGGWDKSQLPGTAGVADVPQAQAQIDKGKKQ
jgi:NodT family efflux transporter outer membrane factor (OMF) lipoprotein